MALSSLVPLLAVRGTVVVDANALALEALGAPAAAVVDQDLAALVADDDRAALDRLLAAADPAVAAEAEILTVSIAART